VARSARSPSPHRGPLPAPFQFSARAPSQEEGEILGSSPPPLPCVASVRSPLHGRRLSLRQLGPHERRLSLRQPGLQRSCALTNSSACHRAHPRRCGGAEPQCNGRWFRQPCARWSPALQWHGSADDAFGQSRTNNSALTGNVAALGSSDHGDDRLCCFPCFSYFSLGLVCSYTLSIFVSSLRLLYTPLSLSFRYNFRP
jgi:hypothetical protein